MEYHISKEKPYAEVKVKHEHFYILALTSHLLKGNQVTNFLTIQLLDLEYLRRQMSHSCWNLY